jgi:ribonuclease R
MTSNTHKNTNFNAKVDPYAQREAEKYDSPIPSRELILALLEPLEKPLGRKQIAEQFGLQSTAHLEALRRRLRAMERDGQLLFNRRQKYCCINPQNLIAGQVLGHPEGFGFLRPENGSSDLFLSVRDMKTLMHNDQVLVHVVNKQKKGRQEAAVVKVLARNTHQLVGRFVKEKGFYLVVADNQKIAQPILIPKEARAHAKKGQIVIVEMVQQPTQYHQPIGKIVEILGQHKAPGMEIEVAIRSHDLPYQWPEAVKKQIKSFKTTVPESAKVDRVDLRDIALVTIDGEDARDFDDAVYCKKTAKGWKLLVAIADVSHYVAVDSPLDVEAKNRSTSVYFPEQVIPMLPEILSNGLCSLKPEVDRLCLVCELYIDQQGQIKRSRFFEAVMRSHARMTYTEVAQLLAGGHPKLAKKYASLLADLQQLYALYKVMQPAREQQGCLDFDTQESKIIFGKNRKIKQIIPTERNEAHKLIEVFMISANQAAAKFLIRKKMPRLLRIHAAPSVEKLLKLRTFLSEMGLHLTGGDKPSPLDFMALLTSVQKRMDAHLIQTVLLRSMSQAVYSPDTQGHFGLALEAYTHFTSPIRRYPDLIVHRAIRHCLQHTNADNFSYHFEDMAGLGLHCSTNERRADEATREVINWLKCDYMADKLGEEFTGIISAVTSFGFFVALNKIYVEGLVHISCLSNDYFHFDAISHHLKGERTGVRYRLGDSVKIKVAGVNLDEKKIDFELLLTDKPSKRGKKSKPRSQR